ncbi:phosphonate metabolism protein/1,5-bisphosphokinase (PRPP-forming) PhnN [Maritalea myrionectae]|uniref:phosphonate metabolism protein/1,5-bisphosphokinase (PRPP-forming) PhnN n=1 Tax=Maritalea myrionectae TaxID=454601 RepID=UPI00042A9252|nr:phosphonate metabolism protein/1,5-bisphosphokinase (PRPP-forming) PhnN [Maritalea myrionectae]
MSDAYKGILIFVVGPSGAGKDSLMAGAASALSQEPNISFVRRLITREAMAELEDHGTISETQYEEMVQQGDFALHWRAHGLGYIIPKTIEDDLRAGKTLICNTSRNQLPIAHQKYPIHVINITAPVELRAERLAGRGRENKEEIEQRLNRKVDALDPALPQTTISNDQSLVVGVEKLVHLIRAVQK